MILYFYKNTKYVEIRVLLNDVVGGAQTEKQKANIWHKNAYALEK